VLVAALILLSGLLHMYFFITGAMLSVLSIALIWFWSPLRPSVMTMLRSMALQVVVPFAVLYSATSFFHPAADRPTDPWGFFSYHSYCCIVADAPGIKHHRFSPFIPNSTPHAGGNFLAGS